MGGGRRSNWQDGRDFAHDEQKIRIARGGEAHGDKSVTPALRAAACPLSFQRPESSPRCDMMSGMRELLWPDYRPSSHRERVRATLGRMTIYNAYYHILVVRDLGRAEREGNGVEHRSFWENSAMLSRVESATRARAAAVRLVMHVI